MLEFTQENGEFAILFLHGWGSDGSIFKGQIDFLKHKYFTLSPDLAGFGKTQIPKEPLSILDYANQIYDYLTAQNVKKVIVVGHSFGGRIAIVLGAKYPKIIKGIVLVDSAGLIQKSLKTRLKILRYKWCKCLVKLRLVDKNKLKKFQSGDYKACDGVMRAIFVKAVNTSLAKYARRVKASTLLIWGEHDQETKLAMGKKFNKLIKNSRLVTLPCGHFPFLECPTLFNGILNAYLEG
ncbi:MAG: alpha/beta hydrolase [Clostridia bacterium]